MTTLNAAAHPVLPSVLTFGSDDLVAEWPSLRFSVAKRLLDVFVALSLLVVLAPLLLLVAILIKLDSPGPAVFRQQRVGLLRRSRGDPAGWHLQTFMVLKFRTMFSDADPSVHASHIRDFVAGKIVAGGAGTGAAFKVRGDNRVTRVGKLLRRASIDELPQLLNVLRGEMSLVGPRPVPAYEAVYYLADDRERFAALPGITGLWQVQGRCNLSCAEMIRLDREYVRRRSFWLDLKILALTIPAVLVGRGAG
jgi:lipopolysaccharide/colanic/teichoic acid biosynthesis glycosyltransferase